MDSDGSDVLFKELEVGKCWVQGIRERSFNGESLVFVSIS